MRFLSNGDPQTGGTINTPAFVVPALGNTGPYPRIYLRNPWIANQDLSVFKNIPFSADGKRYLQLRVEAFNALNPPQFSDCKLTSNVTNSAASLPPSIISERHSQRRLGRGALLRSVLRLRMILRGGERAMCALRR